MNVEFKLPDLGKNGSSGNVVAVLVREGDAIAAGEAVLELETEKTVLDIPCPHAGRVVKVHVVKGQVIQTGQPVLTVEANVRSKADAKATAKSKSREPDAIEDTLAGIPAQRGSREPAVPPGELGKDAFGPVRRERMSAANRALVAEAVRSANAIPQATSFDDADVTELERLCKTIPPAYLGPAIRLTSMPFVAKAVASALRQHPLLNAGVDEEKGEIVYKQYIHLGMAMDAPSGTAAPVLRNVDQLAVLPIARELMVLASRARANEFDAKEFEGATFTIQNVGGAAYGTPMIRAPQAAILLLGRTRWLLGVHEGKVEGRLMMPLSLSYDRRIVDDVSAARFLADVMDYLQSPARLLLK